MAAFRIGNQIQLIASNTIDRAKTTQLGHVLQMLTYKIYHTKALEGVDHKPSEEQISLMTDVLDEIELESENLPEGYTL